MSDSIRGVPVETRWLKFGLVVGIIHLAFLLVLLSLLTVDVTLALAFAVVGSVIGGIAVMLYVTYGT